MFSNYGQTGEVGVVRLCEFLGRLYPEAHFMVTPYRSEGDYVIRLNQKQQL